MIFMPVFVREPESGPSMLWHPETASAKTDCSGRFFGISKNAGKWKVCLTISDSCAIMKAWKANFPSERRFA